MRKIAFCTGLLGAGTLSIPLRGEAIPLAPLLYLVPVVAIAFDFYIMAEEYRVKRAGAFLRKPASGASEEEMAWEDFASRHPNHLATFAFLLVTLILLAGSSFVLLYTGADQRIFWPWVGVILAAESVPVLFSLFLRWWLRRDALTKDYMREKSPSCAENT